MYLSSKGGKIFMNMCEESMKDELKAEEVNIYEETCGELQFHCLNDCFGGGAWLSVEY